MVKYDWKCLSISCNTILFNNITLHYNIFKYAYFTCFKIIHNILSSLSGWCSLSSFCFTSEHTIDFQTCTEANITYINNNGIINRILVIFFLSFFKYLSIKTNKIITLSFS